ncbi:CoA transferase [Undibacterium arcticum]|uniref:CoA transferase n=1 Tax=Undibacterium arcticum TaxID=1762892 RepID=A0ABV7F9J2_9BURK
MSCGPIADLAQVFEDVQVQPRGMKIDLPHPTAGTVPLLASPIRTSETPVPGLGTEQIAGRRQTAIIC